MAITIDYQRVYAPADISIPSLTQLQRWFDSVLHILDIDTVLEVTVRLVDISEIIELNTQYRHKAMPTNVLSFPFEAILPEGPQLLGDIVVAVAVVNQEAIVQHKPAMAHWAHITIHGLLHLLGYDHIDPVEAEEMEAIEVRVLAELNIPNPYQIEG